MIITYGKTILRSKYTYLIAALIIFMTDGLFNDIVTNNKKIVGKKEAVQGVASSEDSSYGKNVIVFCFAATILFVGRMSPFMQKLAIAYYLLFMTYSMESYLKYGSFLKYPHVFSKLMAVFLMFFLYNYFRNVTVKQFRVINYLIFFAFMVNLLWLKREILSIGAFVNTVRGFGSNSVLFLVLPLLYFFNDYFKRKTFISLLLFLLMLGFILFLNHRSVWIASIVALFINILLLKKTDIELKLTDFLPIITVPSIAFILIFSLVISANPEIIETIVERIADIQNAETQGTGSWRLEQFYSYLPYIQDNLLIGMRFEGFELPVQFFHAEAGTAVFAANTGHHFHSFYVDRVFYMGMFGLFLLLLPFFYLFINIFRKSVVTSEQAILVSFVAGGLIYGFSYNLPVYFFGLLGIAVAFVEREHALKEANPL